MSLYFAEFVFGVVFLFVECGELGLDVLNCGAALRWGCWEFTKSGEVGFELADVGVDLSEFFAGVVEGQGKRIVDVGVAAVVFGGEHILSHFCVYVVEVCFVGGGSESFCFACLVEVSQTFEDLVVVCVSDEVFKVELCAFRGRGA